LKKFIFIAILCVSWSSRVSFQGGSGYNELEIPLGFPAIIYPEGNEPSESRWILGKKLFFDPIMSRDGSISCSSCHAPHLAFSDSVALSPGAGRAAGKRNAPSLSNVAYHPYYTRDGSIPTLEMQILVPIQEHNEFDSNILEIAERLSKDSAYCQMSRAAYGRMPDSYVITRSLANYERSLISGNSPYDQYTFQGNKKALTEHALDGMKLFFSERAQCSSCHGGFNFTDYGFENNGLYLQYPDSGRIRFSELETDRARFKVPSLRNLTYTAPYMHDGSKADLHAVIDHYSEGMQLHENLSKGLEPMHFTLKEKESLIAFLLSLNDSSFVKAQN